MYYPEELVEEIRESNDIVDVISDYVKLQRKGSSYFGLCPFHNEKSPSFSVSPAKQMYYCFGCGAGGNVFTFLMEYENLTFPEAVKMLAERAGISLPEQEYTSEMRRQQDEKTAILEVNKMAAKYFYYQLRSPSGEAGMKYLKGRQLTDETMKSFGLGYANKYSDDLYRYLKGKGVSDDLLKDSGLMSVDERHGMHDKFWNRVMFPIFDVNGKVIGFGGRVMGDGKPKYLNSPETKVFDKSRNLYGLNVARTSRKKYLLVCEGYMDVISLHQAGFQNAVASLGTALTLQHASLLKRYTKEVILTYDSDEAGVRAALRAIPILKEAGISTRVLHMDPYKDPDEFIKALGSEAFEERIRQAENSFMFEISVLEREYNMKDPESKTAFYEAIAEKILNFEVELERENYIEAVADRYHMGFENLRKLVNRMAVKGTKPARTREVSRGEKSKEKEDGIQKAQKLMLTWLIEQKGLYEKIRTYIGPEDFTQEPYRNVAHLLFEQLKKGEVNPAKIINCFEDTMQQREVAGLFNSTVKVETEQELKKAFNDTLHRIMEHSLEYQSEHLEPSDIEGLQKIVEGRRKLEEVRKLHISID